MKSFLSHFSLLLIPKASLNHKTKKKLKSCKNLKMSQKITKKRLPNFSSAEEDLLITLAEMHANIIENKETDTVSWETKRQAWEKINEEFEANTGMKRGAKNLKDKYENLKRKARRSLAKERESIYATGGGQFVQCTNSTTNRVAALIGTTVVGLPNIVDKDATINETPPQEEYLDISMGSLLDESIVQEEEATEDVEVTEDQNNSLVTIDTTTKNWSSWNPNLLRTKPNEKLREPLAKKGKQNLKNTETNGKNGKTKADSYNAFYEEERERAVERHDWAREKHNLEIKEAEMKLELLQLEINKARQELRK